MAMKKGLCIILCGMLSMLLSGCWSRKEPKTLALVNSIIYDLSDNGGYEVTAEVINPAAQGSVKDGGSGKSPNITLTSIGSSFPEAVRNVSESLERTVFGGHNKVRFFTEKLAQKDITSIMDYVLRDRLTDENPLMVVIKHAEPELVYSSMLGLSETVGDYIESMSETQPATMSKSVFVKTLDFIKDYYNEGKQPIAGVVDLVECESKPSNNTVTDTGAQIDSNKKYRIIYKGLAAFKDKKLAGYMDEIEARAYNFVTGNVESAVISIVFENSETVVIVYDPKAKIKTEIQDDQVTVHVEIKTRMSIIQESGTLDISKMGPLKTVEAAFNQQMAKEISAAIEKAQTDFQSDIFGFGIAMHKQHPKEWKEIKENWDAYFAKATVNVSVESTADRTGGIKQPFSLEVE